ncbi:hypothetical protein D9615_007551 [Tricholomella constricta]|uniref:G domain-containing protein n=1 Tax=Tricholomella constricta TaxID=117010 RepID=A0A8H5M1U6_9AGAR|nr:hypothetical protein D9615_007551 [Tricholomella constricta]
MLPANIQAPPPARTTQGIAEAQKYSSNPAYGQAATSYQDSRISDHIRHLGNSAIASNQAEGQTLRTRGSSAENTIFSGALRPEGTVGVPNILIFGETGTGKSSAINLIAGRAIAGVSGDAQGYTFGSTAYTVFIDDGSGTMQVTFWDTAGLNEGEHGTVPAVRAMKNLQELVGNLSGGLSLLVYCIRGSRFRRIWKVNYDLFAGIICQGRVPVVLLVTGLEDESPTMENWWTENGAEFAKHGMRFNGHACITSTRGKQLKSGEYMYEEEYEESEKVARKLISDYCVGSPWVMDSRAWISEITSKMASYYETDLSEHPERRGETEGRRSEARQIGGQIAAGGSHLPIILEFIVTCLSYLMPSREPDYRRRRGPRYRS